jgi:hypothetical protein
MFFWFSDGYASLPFAFAVCSEIFQGGSWNFINNRCRRSCMLLVQLSTECATQRMTGMLALPVTAH